MKPIQTVALIGLGAIGCSMARGLRDAVGAEGFRVIAAGARRKRIEKGVRINGELCHFPVTAPDAQTGPADLVVVAVKYLALPQAIQDIRSQVGPETVILSFLNGVTSEQEIADVYGWEHVLYAMVRKSVVMQDGVCTYGDWGTYYFGERQNPTVSARVQPLCDLFTRAGLRWEVPQDMVREQWIKYMGNISENQSSAILGIPYGAWHTDGNDANWIREAACREVLAVAKEMGIDLGQAVLENQRAIVKSVPADGKTSMLQDLEAGRPTEVDMFAGALCRLGRAHGVPTPVNDLFYHMIRVLEQKNRKTE